VRWGRRKRGPFWCFGGGSSFSLDWGGSLRFVLLVQFLRFESPWVDLWG